MNRKMVLGEAEVDNPYFAADHPENGSNPRKVRALINVRESAVVSLASRGFLNAHQKRAASHFTEAWEISSGLHGESFGEFVDHRYQPSISDSVIDAGRELRECREHLGLRNYMLLVAVCGYGRSLSEMYPVKRDRLTAADNLRGSLDDLAYKWGYMGGRNHSVDNGNRLGR